MTSPEQSQVANRLLSVLPSKSFERLQPFLSPASLPLRAVLVAENVETEFVYFLDSGLSSIIALNGESEERIEIGHIGWEGMVGLHVVHHVPSSPNRIIVQVEGFGWRMPVRPFQAALEEDPSLRTLMLRYAHSHEVQVSQSALANGRYTLHERLARWILMSHDRSPGSELYLTHEFLSLMLGVRRSGVTNELHILEGLHAIRSTRGVVQVIDRALLEEIANGCYGIPEREYERVIGIDFRMP